MSYCDDLERRFGVETLVKRERFYELFSIAKDCIQLADSCGLKDYESVQFIHLLHDILAHKSEFK